jgi:hypothetical protein
MSVDEGSSDKTALVQPTQYFSSDAFVVRLLNMVAILSTFGVILPPVAVVCVVAALSVTLQTQLIIGRLVTLSLGTQMTDILNTDCKGAADMFMSSLAIVTPFAAVFHAFFLSDILGDAVGWRHTLWVPSVLCGLPILIRLVYFIVKRTHSSVDSAEKFKSGVVSEKNENNQQNEEEEELECVDGISLAMRNM